MKAAIRVNAVSDMRVDRRFEPGGHTPPGENIDIIIGSINVSIIIKKRAKNPKNQLTNAATAVATTAAAVSIGFTPAFDAAAAVANPAAVLADAIAAAEFVTTAAFVEAAVDLKSALLKSCRPLAKCADFLFPAERICGPTCARTVSTLGDEKALVILCRPFVMEFLFI
jgi:hypothetical protein